MDIGINLTAVVLLLVVNGFFVAAEFALVKARGFRIEAQASEGSTAARLTLRIQANLEAYLAACQLGITMASLGLGWVGEPAVAALLEPLFHWAGVPDSVLHTSAFIVGFLIFSSLHIVVGEQVPKTFAIRKAEAVSLWVAYPLHVSYLMVWPLNWLLNKAAQSTLALFRVEQATHGDVLSGDELKGLVATSKEHGEIGGGKADMLHNLFEFHQRSVGRVMIPRGAVLALDLAAEPDRNLRMISNSGHSRFPLLDSAKDDAIAGIVLAKDLHNALLGGEPEPWKDLGRYSRPPLVVHEGHKIDQVFELMRRDRAHMGLVVDEYGQLVGIITLEDLLEEIVGEIHDETDEEEPVQAIQKLSDSRWECDGLVSLSDVERSVGLTVPAVLDANTLSGLCMERLARMPAPGDQFQEGPFRVLVQTIQDRRVGRVVIERVDDEQEDQGGWEGQGQSGDTRP